MIMLQVSQQSMKRYQLKYGVWLKKFDVSVNQTTCKKIKRAVFTYEADETEKTIKVKGNMLTGFKLIDSDESIVMMRPLQGYEWFWVLFPWVALLSVSLLLSIRVGLGGTIGGLLSIGVLFVMRQISSPFLKCLVSVLYTLGATVLFFIIAIVFSGASV